MPKYENKEQNVSIEVPTIYTLVEKKHYEQIGLDKQAQEQTLFLFINTNSVTADTFNVTRDAVYNSDEEALNNGVQANVDNMQKQGYQIVNRESFVTMQGKNCVKVIALYNNELYVNLLFVALNGMLVCLGYSNEQQDYQKEALFEKIVSSIEKIN